MSDSLVKHVPKGWGYEKWIVNNERYCGKLLFFESGKKCSWHYHKVKHETFYLHSGKIYLYYGFDDDFYTRRPHNINPWYPFRDSQGHEASDGCLGRF